MTTVDAFSRETMRFVVVQDYKENRRKCSLRPLEDLEEFQWMRLSHPPSEPRGPLSSVELGDGILLAVDAPPLSIADRAFVEGEDRGTSAPIVILDSTWRRLEHLHSRLTVRPGAQLLRRSLPRDWCTAYPRVSKVFDDPEQGLASVEALFVATAVLGEPRHDFLRNYRWRDDFLRRNEAHLGGPATHQLR
jgi:pre-rRNA-processing protein TSR3